MWALNHSNTLSALLKSLACFRFHGDRSTELLVAAPLLWCLVARLPSVVIFHRALLEAFPSLPFVFEPVFFTEVGRLADEMSIIPNPARDRGLLCVIEGSRVCSCDTVIRAHFEKRCHARNVIWRVVCQFSFFFFFFAFFFGFLISFISQGMYLRQKPVGRGL